LKDRFMVIERLAKDQSKRYIVCNPDRVKLLQLDEKSLAASSSHTELAEVDDELGEPNVYMTFNMDPRAWPDARQLLYELHHGKLPCIVNESVQMAGFECQDEMVAYQLSIQ
jgi:hypothetical protein